jgi:hypothetical protein
MARGNTDRLGRSFKGLVLAVALASPLALAQSALAGGNGNIVFSSGEGTAAPASTLGPYTMTPFAPDPATDGTLVTSAPGPFGALGLSNALTKATVPLNWGTWSNGYMSTVYFSATEESVTITLPSGTAAAYFYIESDVGGTVNFTVTAEDGLAADTTSSPPTPTNSAGNAAYFGFYATAGQTISKIAIAGPTPADGFAVGEFGIAAVAPPTVATGAATDITTTGAQLEGTVNPNNNPTSSFFEYGTTASYGQGAPSTSAHDGNGTEPVTASAALAGLQPGTLYHYRLVATNGVGTRVNGADETFATTSAPLPLPLPPPSTPPLVKHCAVPKLSHLSLRDAKSVLGKAGCALGKVKQLKRPKSTKGLSFGVLAQSPASGTTTAAPSKVSVTLGWFKHRKAHK